MVGVRTARVGEKEICSQLKPYAFILHTLQESYSLYKTLFTEKCEGMLSLHNDKIRPEVACATPLGGKDYTCCIETNEDSEELLRCWMHKLR